MNNYKNNIDKLIEDQDTIKDSKINWTNAWSKKYPVLKTYQGVVDVEKYAIQLRNLLNDLKEKYNYNKEDAMLVLKDILYHEYKDNNKKEK